MNTRNHSEEKRASATSGHKGGRTEQVETKALPVHTVRIGGVKVTVWKNRTSTGYMYNSTLIRVYRTEQGDWGESHSFSRDDLLAAAKALDLAHTFIMQAEAEARTHERPQDTE